MLLGGKSYAIATRKLSNRKMIALRLTFCSIFPILLLCRFDALWACCSAG